ncbi:MAG: hypothetical protein FWE12_01455 [Oscillospiraceae bacterium]|nr:hypothetical protein [Oscillospiraceae bacterium]
MNIFLAVSAAESATIDNGKYWAAHLAKLGEHTETKSIPDSTYRARAHHKAVCEAADQFIQSLKQ